MKTNTNLLFSFLILLTWAEVAMGQGEQTKRFDMDDCIDYALEHEASSLNATLDEQIARLRVKETVGLGLPQVSTNVSLQHNPELPRFFAQYDATVPDGEGFGPTHAEAQALGMEDGDAFGSLNFFQLPSAGDANLSINQLIFDGSYIVGLQAAKTYKELSVKQKQYARGELGAAVAKAFFTVLINEDRLRLYTSNLSRLETLYRETQELFNNGFAEQIEVDRMKVSLNNATAQKSNYENLVLLSRRLLKFQMNYPLDQPLELEGSIEDVLDNSSIRNVTRDFDLENRHDYQVLEVSKKLEELNLKNMYAGAIPSISAFATLGYSTQSPNFGGLFSTNSTFAEQPEIGHDKWYNYSVVGVKLNWSLFTGLQRNYQIQQQKAKLQKLENDIDQFKDMVSIEVSDAALTLENSLRELKVQEENMELAENIYKVSEAKYKQGMGSSLEVIDAENGLQQARTNFYNTLYNAAIAKIDLVRAVGVRD